MKASTLASQQHSLQHSPYTVVNKKMKVVKGGAVAASTYQELGGTHSKKQSGNTLRYDLQHNLISRLGNGEEPPKFSHASTTKNIFNPKSSSAGFSTDFS